MNAFAYRLAAFAFILALSAPIAARDCRPQVREGWVRMAPGNTMPMRAGFGRIVNGCAMPATIISASSPSFGSVELHETRLVDGISRMRPVPQLRLPPNSRAVLKPGGMHLMLMRPSAAALMPGSRIVIKFELAGGGTLSGEFELRKPEL